MFFLKKREQMLQFLVKTNEVFVADVRWQIVLPSAAPILCCICGFCSFCKSANQDVYNSKCRTVFCIYKYVITFAFICAVWRHSLTRRNWSFGGRHWKQQCCRSASFCLLHIWLLKYQIRTTGNVGPFKCLLRISLMTLLLLFLLLLLLLLLWRETNFTW